MAIRIISPTGYKEGKVYSINPLIPSATTFDLPFTRATTKTRINKKGEIEAVPYNLLEYSEQFENAVWVKGVPGSVAGNQGISPIGTTTADRLVFTGNSSDSLTSSAVLKVGVTYNFSVWIKSNTGSNQNFKFSINDSTTRVTTTEWKRFNYTFTCSNVSEKIGIIPNVLNDTLNVLIWGAQLSVGTDLKQYFQTTTRLNVPSIDYQYSTTSGSLLLEPSRTNLLLNSETLSTQSVAVTNVAHTLSFYGTGTIVLSDAHTATLVGTGSTSRVMLTFTPTAGSLTLTVSGDVKNAQLEVGAYETSYIGTTSTSVTRNADTFFLQNVVVNNVNYGIGATWYLEFVNNKSYIQDVAGPGLFLGDNSSGINSSICVSVGTNGRLNVARYAGANRLDLAETYEDNVKIIIKLDGTNVTVYINGAKIIVSPYTATSLNNLRLLSTDVPRNIKSMWLSPTVLTDKQCIEATLITETFDSDYQTLLTTATSLGYSLPSTYQQRLQNSFVKALKNYGIWSKLDILYVYATDASSNFALLNWKNPSLYEGTIAATGVTFEANQGFRSTSAIANGAIFSPFNPATNAVQFQMDNASQYMYLNSLTSGVYIANDANNCNRLSIRATANDNTVNYATHSSNFTFSAVYPTMRSIHKPNTTNITYSMNYTQSTVTSTAGTGIFSGNRRLLNSCIASTAMYAMGASLVNENNNFVSIFEGYKNSLI
jgi:hypothetical protein